MTENLPDTNVGNIEYIRKQDALDAFGLSEKTFTKGQKWSRIKRIT